ncbi:hypothetical protein R1flu_004838 [Riccia fluitans]|uniref:N-acetylglucosaminylphosphatidylinositol deacetylase n=1 Tax=Riccia fluitans TaxID=41844 RepID=A0ABD1YSF0_9MARC
MICIICRGRRHRHFLISQERSSLSTRTSSFRCNFFFPHRKELLVLVAEEAAVEDEVVEVEEDLGEGEEEVEEVGLEEEGLEVAEEGVEGFEEEEVVVSEEEVEVEDEEDTEFKKLNVTEWLLPIVVVWWAMGMMCLILFPHYLLKPLPSSTSGINEQKVKRYLLLVAHPDDECMFFGPTLLSLSMLGGCEFHVLCISNGNADGLGSLRKIEMMSSCSVFKVPAENVTILDHPSLQDGHHQQWSQDLLVQIIAETVETQAIDCVITFDGYGVSGHPNHFALSHSLRAYLTQRWKYATEDILIEGWELESVNILRKYSGVLEIFLSSVRWLWSRKEGDFHCFVTPNPLTSVEAMKQHKSQWLWFRRLFVIFASYTYVNILRQVPSIGDKIMKKQK